MRSESDEVTRTCETPAETSGTVNALLATASEFRHTCGVGDRIAT